MTPLRAHCLHRVRGVSERDVSALGVPLFGFGTLTQNTALIIVKVKIKI